VSERVVLGHHETLGVLLWPRFKQLRMFTLEERDDIYEKARREMATFPPSERATTEPEVTAQIN